MKARLLGIGILIAFGLARAPIESGMQARQRELHFHGATLNIRVWQQLSQLGFVAALSGFRAVAASILNLQAHTAWSRVEWGRLKSIYDTMCALDPRNMQSWDMGGWHMAFNASVAALQDETQPRIALRLKAQREYFKAGEDFYLRGIENNPDHALLYERLAMVYRDKFQDHEKASIYFDRAAAQSDAMPYVHRFGAYELAKVPGREREAYARLKGLYDRGEQEHLPTLLKLLGQMEEKLNVPREQRTYNPTPQKP